MAGLLNDTNVKREIVRNGLMAAIVVFIVSQGFTLLMSKMNNPLGVLGIVVLMFIAVITLNVFYIRRSMVNVRDKYQGGKIKFGNAFVIGLTTNLLSLLVSSLLYLIVLLIFKEAYDNMQIDLLQKSVDYMEQNGVAQEEIDKLYDQMDEVRNTSAVEGVMKTLVQGVLFAFVIPLIVAASIKKDTFMSNTNASTI